MKGKRILKCFTMLLIVLCGCGSVLTFAEQNVQISAVWENKITKELSDKMQTASDDEKLSVYIWYKDINYDLVENQVKQDTGLTIESIDTPLAMPDEELLNHIVTLSDESIEDNITAEEIKNQFEQYIEKTREQRLVEQQMTDVYIENRRAVARQKYIEKATLLKNNFL